MFAPSSVHIIRQSCISHDNLHASTSTKATTISLSRSVLSIGVYGNLLILATLSQIVVLSSKAKSCSRW